MCAEENSDLESMLNNPFRSLGAKARTETDVIRPAVNNEIRPATPEEPKPVDSTPAPAQDSRNRMERSHPSDIRILALEKNDYNTRQKIDDIKRIIEHQNERIRLLEEELGFHRNESSREAD